MPENENQPPGQPAAGRANRTRSRRRAKPKNLLQRIFGRLPLPTWLLSALAFAQEAFTNFRWLKRAFEYGEHTQFASDILSAAGVTMPGLVSFVASPIFGVGLLVLGFGYAFFVPEKRRNAAKSPYSAVAWIVVALSATLMVSALIVKTTLEQPAIVELARSHPGKPRHLSADQIESLKSSYKKHPSLANTMFYIASSTDDESQVYEGEIYDALKDAGAHIIGAPLGTCGNEIGISVTLFDPDNPSPQAIDIMAVLSDAKLKYHKQLWEKRHRDGWPEAPDFVLFVCPSADKGGNS